MKRRVTSIYLLKNIDGIHTSEELIGYIQENSFVVLTRLVFNYYINQYNDHKIYEIYLACHNSALKIVDEGEADLSRNFAKCKYSSLGDFLRDNIDKIESAKTVLDNTDPMDSTQLAEYKDLFNEYLGLVNSYIHSDNADPRIQKAIDCNDIFKPDDILDLNSSLDRIVTKCRAINNNFEQDDDLLAVMASAINNYIYTED